MQALRNAMWVIMYVGMAITLLGVGLDPILQRAQGLRWIGTWLAIFESEDIRNLWRRLMLLAGALLLLTVAILDKASFFIALEIVVVAGATISLITIGGHLKILTLIFILFLVARPLNEGGQMREIAGLVSACSLTLLAVGYALDNSRIYFLAGIALTASCLISYNDGYEKALPWAFFNLIFALITDFHVP